MVRQFRRFPDDRRCRRWELRRDLSSSTWRNRLGQREERPREARWEWIRRFAAMKNHWIKNRYEWLTGKWVSRHTLTWTDWRLKIQRKSTETQGKASRIGGSQSQSQNQYACTHGHTWTVCVFLEWYPCNLSPTLSDPCWSVIKVTTPLNCRNQESNIKALNGSSKLPAISYERINI